jgi:hypothetical protein
MWSLRKPLLTWIAVSSDKSGMGHVEGTNQKVANGSRDVTLDPLITAIVPFSQPEAPEEVNPKLWIYIVPMVRKLLGT